jgi:hypothetical protein
VKYVVTADDKLIDGQVERIKKQFGTAFLKRGCSGADWERLHKRRK